MIITILYNENVKIRCKKLESSFQFTNWFIRIIKTKKKLSYECIIFYPIRDTFFNKLKIFVRKNIQFRNSSCTLSLILSLDYTHYVREVFSFVLEIFSLFYGL